MRKQGLLVSNTLSGVLSSLSMRRCSRSCRSSSAIEPPHMCLLRVFIRDIGQRASAVGKVDHEMGHTAAVGNKSGISEQVSGQLRGAVVPAQQQRSCTAPHSFRRTLLQLHWLAIGLRHLY